MFGAVGLVFLKLISMQRLANVRQLTGAILIGAVGLLLVTKVMGTSANGAQRWLAVGPDPDPGFGDREDLADALRREPAGRAAGDDPRPSRHAADPADLGSDLRPHRPRARPRDGDGHSLLDRGAADRGRGQDPPSRHDRRSPLPAGADRGADGAVPDGPPDQFHQSRCGRRRGRLPGQQASIALGSGGIFGVGIGRRASRRPSTYPRPTPT